MSPLPPSNIPSLYLTQATLSEKCETWKLNGQHWRGTLTLPTYLRREEHLADQPLTRNGGVTYWVLVDSEAEANTPRRLLASCETYRKRALVATASRVGEVRVEEVTSHGIGSVFCNPAYRGKGYAGRMMIELGKKLEKWQQKEEKTSSFTVLYSDIGKEFYARRGWKPYTSSHTSLPPIPETEVNRSLNEALPKSSSIYPSDLHDLCLLDEKLLRKHISQFPPIAPYTRVALIPDVETLQWHHSREEFIAEEVLGRNPEVKGAIVDLDEGGKVWCIWTRTFGAQESENVLHILRLVIEKDDEFGPSDVEGERSSESSDDKRRERFKAVRAVLKAAQLEAAKWDMQSVEIWNPTPLVVLAAKEILPSTTVIHRDEESIASLMWYGSGDKTEDKVEWVGNDKYGWC